MWCGECYQQHPHDKFPVLSAQDLDDALINDEEMEDEDPLRFKEARNGDQLMTPFQCDHCHFGNIQGRRPIADRNEDAGLLLCIRRANLDAFWSRERSTVYANLREGIRFEANCRKLGITNSIPGPAPFPTCDSFGMTVAVAMLMRSLDAGKNSSTVQFETMRKMRGFFSNMTHATHGGLGAVFMAEDRSAGVVTNAVTNGPWFKRFVRGCHRRMGDVWLPDRPLTIDELTRALELLEEDWLNLEDDVTGRAVTAETATMLLAGFFGALRGEEIIRTDVGAMRKYWGEATTYREAPHVPLMLSGRFKRELGEKLFTQPLACTNVTGIPIALWFHRRLTVLESLGVVDGPMFRNWKGKRASVGDLDVLYISILKRVQRKWPNVIPDSIEVAKECSALRSMRRGATAEAQNSQIPQEVINANNRWRKHERSRGLTPGMSMMERYTDAKASVPALVRFSSELGKRMRTEPNQAWNLSLS